jgi:hypothetical protein
MENPAPPLAPFGSRMLIHRQWNFVSNQLPGAVRDYNLLRKIRALRVMENHHHCSYQHWLPGSGVLDKHGDAEQQRY